MDPLDISSFESLGASGGTKEQEDEQFHSLGEDDLFGDKEDLFGYKEDLFENKEDDFEGSFQVKTAPPKLSSTKESNLLFSFDDGGAPGTGSSNPPGSLTDMFADFGESSGTTSGGLFDDLLDFTGTGSKTGDLFETTEKSPEDNKPVSNVDLLFGVDDDLVPAVSQEEVASKHPDILDFFDAIPPTAAEEITMETEDTAPDSLDSFVIVNNETSLGENETSPVKNETSPDILITSASMDVDGMIEDEHKEEEKKDECTKEDTQTPHIEVEEEDKVDGAILNIRDQDFDFSVMQLSESPHLNFDHLKHKRTLSQKGSIARRKKPTRGILHSDNEDSIFKDSTEPKPVKHVEDEADSSSAQAQLLSKEPQKKEEEPAKRFGGVKIPGLLEGLSKSKVFSKSEKSSEPEKPARDKSPTPAVRASSPSNTPSPVVRPKPLVMPRVLPSISLRATSKTIKDTQNQSTAGENGSTKPAGESSTSQVKDSKVNGAAVESPRDVKLTPAPEKVAPKVSPSLNSVKVLPSKPDLHSSSSPTVQISPKPAAKVPPPVPNKPSVPLRPSRSNLFGSASFSASDKPNPVVAKRTALPPLAQKNGDKNSLNLKEPAPETDIQNSSKEKDSTFPSETTSKNSLSSKSSDSTPVPKREPLSFLKSDSDLKKNTAITRASSMRTTGLTSDFLDKTRLKSVESKVSAKENQEDVFQVETKTVVNANSTAPCDRSNSQDDTKENVVAPRKSSITGVSSVKSPSAVDKNQSNRRGSFTGSAYNPIGFRPAVVNADEVSRSRGSSTSSMDGSLALSSPIIGEVVLRQDLLSSSDSQKSKEGPVTVVNKQEKITLEKSLDETKVIKTTSSQQNRWEVNKKEAAEVTNNSIKNQTKSPRDSVLLNKSNGTITNTEKKEGTPEKSSSPWGVRLRKVEKKVRQIE
ncbi:nucleolar protein dao-5-like [Physella acuta]|uniref:nucleolar protein dao-5-like n=1 Tax=Physella acuta TaxID=109671 RepID=UPI0027DE9FDB|nr:nucleolar protein dao-5-like [Physella acuta]